MPKLLNPDKRNEFIKNIIYKKLKYVPPKTKIQFINKPKICEQPVVKIDTNYQIDFFINLSQ